MLARSVGLDPTTNGLKDIRAIRGCVVMPPTWPGPAAHQRAARTQPIMRLGASGPDDRQGNDALAHLRIGDHTPFRFTSMRKIAAAAVLGLDLRGDWHDPLGQTSPRATKLSSRASGRRPASVSISQSTDWRS